MDRQQAFRFNPRIAASRAYTEASSFEALQERHGLDSLIVMAANENPVGPSPRAVEAIQQAVTALNRYPSIGDQELREALADFVGEGTTADYFFTGRGGGDVLAMLAQALLSPGDECIICPPTFPVYEIVAGRNEATTVHVPLLPDFSYDIDAILAAVTARTRLIYICNPNNPTGSIITAAQMETLLNHIPDHVFIIADEVYHHFATSPHYTNSLAHVLAGKNVIVLHSFSKAFGLAGLRLGYAICDPAVAGYLARVRQAFHISRLAMIGGLAALQDREHLERTISIIVPEREKLYTRLQALGFTVWPSQASFILFKPSFAAEPLAGRLLQQGILIREMSPFYLPGHIRISVGLPQENERLMAALKRC